MLEKSVIEHCSPTLASIKNPEIFFTYKYESEEELWKSVEGFNECCKRKRRFPSQYFAGVRKRR